MNEGDKPTDYEAGLDLRSESNSIIDERVAKGESLEDILFSLQFPKGFDEDTFAKALAVDLSLIPNGKAVLYGRNNLKHLNGLTSDEKIWISREHIKIAKENGRFFIINEGKNGTAINDFDISEGDPHKLENGDIIELGRRGNYAKFIFIQGKFYYNPVYENILDQSKSSQTYGLPYRSELMPILINELLGRVRSNAHFNSRRKKSLDLY